MEKFLKSDPSYAQKLFREHLINSPDSASDLSQAITDLAKHLTLGWLPKGEAICKTGDRDDCLYILLRGKVQLAVVRSGEGSAKRTLKKEKSTQPQEQIEEPAELVKTQK